MKATQHTEIKFVIYCKIINQCSKFLFNSIFIFCWYINCICLLILWMNFGQNYARSVICILCVLYHVCARWYSILFRKDGVRVLNQEFFWNIEPHAHAIFQRIIIIGAPPSRNSVNRWGQCCLTIASGTPNGLTPFFHRIWNVTLLPSTVAAIWR